MKLCFSQASLPKLYEPYPVRRPDEGYFGVQNHSDQDVVYFKEIAIKPLPGYRLE